MDQITPQVLIQAKVLEMVLGDTDNLGVKWNVSINAVGPSRKHTFPFSATDPKGTHRLNNYLPAAAPGTATFPTPNQPGASLFPYAVAGDFVAGTLDLTDFTALLEMIQTRKDTKVLSEPHIVTMNNQQAKILVGEKISIPTFERNSTSGKMEITGYDEKDVGISLLVTPQINSANEILVNMNPKIEALLGYDALADDIVAPRFSTREAQTQVRVKSGETIVIGGLIKEEIVNTVTKVPFLGDLPLIGKVFSHQDKTVDKTNLLFFMTVTVVTDKTGLPQGHKL